ncbi:MAG: hypothetical protein A2622_00325 [Bdellovibrionales bacterium RIFCSPHIGHO2_01_FULL_40_29]|nr:MAG: hypothetical protein A2622_00325 [Bdellovibrionales bacterium RIFCSPHIGHO2_01_FULL_40_29]OFZ32570.1 MAG: hypothetical protein A3D17_04925 [Bdellovibrionales bacterium RIFCSPHIGHO2_02_FULL_40_15]
MKTIFKNILQLAVISILVSGSTVLAETPAVRDVVISVSDAFVPGGFDSEADAYVIVNGLYPNGCYRWKTAEISNDDAFNHNIRSVASVSQGMCIMVLVPFTKEVRLGKLATGTHTLKFVNGDGTYLQKTLNVE